MARAQAFSHVGMLGMHLQINPRKYAMHIQAPRATPRPYLPKIAIWTGSGITSLALTGAVVLSLDISPSAARSVAASTVFPVGPADRDVAARYGVIDHSKISVSDILPDTDPAPTF